LGNDFGLAAGFVFAGVLAADFTTGFFEACCLLDCAA
jgi:hypothetical protein